MGKSSESRTDFRETKRQTKNITVRFEVPLSRQRKRIFACVPDSRGAKYHGSSRISTRGGTDAQAPSDDNALIV